LVFLRAQREGIHVDTSVGVAGVVLEGLHHVEVRALALGEAVLAVELELGSDNGVFAPAVHVKSGLSKHEGAGIRHKGALVARATLVGEGDIGEGVGGPDASGRHVGSIGTTSHLEEAGGVDKASGTGNLLGATESVDGVGESINGVGVVEGLGAESAVEKTTRNEGRAVIDVGIGLDDPDKLLARVVEVELNLVGAASN
jgi:hypothetical protein